MRTNPKTQRLQNESHRYSETFVMQFKKRSKVDMLGYREASGFEI